MTIPLNIHAIFWDCIINNSGETHFSPCKDPKGGDDSNKPNINLSDTSNYYLEQNSTTTISKNTKIRFMEKKYKYHTPLLSNAPLREP